MRFVCDSCRAQYMISDEKIGAKGVKVRCKKCGYVILVRRADNSAPAVPPPHPPEPEDGQATQIWNNPLAEGNPNLTADGVLGTVGEDEIGAVFDQALKSGNNAVPSEAGNGALGDEDDDRVSTRVLDADTVKKLAAEAGPVGEEAPAETKGEGSSDGEADWFVAIDEKQVGPMSVEKLKGHWEQGKIGPDSLCWRAGLPDWVPLSEVAELAAELAPRPQKPVIVAPSPVAPVVSIPVESAFSAGGTTKTVRSEVQVPMGMGAPDQTIAEWRPSAASALASLVKEEIHALSNKAPAKSADEGAPSGMGGLLDVPAADAGLKGHPPAASYPGDPGLSRPPAPAVTPFAPASTYPGYAVPTSRNRGLVVGLSVGAVALVAVLVGLVVFLALRPPQTVVLQPAAAPAASVAEQAISPEEKPETPAVPAEAKATPAPNEKQVGAAEPKSEPKAPSGAATAPPARKERPERERAEREKAPEKVAAVEKEKPSKPVPEPSGDEFDSVFGGGGKSSAREEKSGSGSSSRKPSVYVPPAPGSGGSIPERLGQSDIMQVVLANRSALARCAEQQRKKEPGVSGTLVMKWTVQTSGRTSNVTVVSQEFKSTYMASCIGGLIKGWSFPRHKTQGEPVQFPFKF